MNVRSIVTIVALGLGAAFQAQARVDPSPTGRVAYVNGRLFDGTGFRRGSLVVEGGRFVAAAPGTAGRTVDLEGGFVLPPFGEAHNHDIHHTDELAEKVARYLRQGVFYVKNPSSVLARPTPRSRSASSGTSSPATKRASSCSAAIR
jgi:hypothetical protein